MARRRESSPRKAFGRKALVVRRELREFSIFIVVVAVENGHDEVPFTAAGFGERFASGEESALEH